ncbi:MAG: hypothetical protein IT258_02340, partial [Saprospiraceae bacterium]|nr:hypothetical protein [Saprospiraceae bacterium]
MSKIRKELDAKIKMFKAIALLYLTYKPRFDVVSAFTGVMTNFNDRNTLIDKLVPLAMMDTKDMTKQRDALRAPLYVSAMIVAKAVKSYAAGINDLVLVGEMNWTVAKLKAVTLDQLGPTCTKIHESGTKFLEQSTPFGLTKDKLDKLDTDNKAWIAKESATRNLQVEISGNKVQLENKVAENMALLTSQLDEMVMTLSDSDPALVGLWEQARIIVHLRSTETQAKILVKDKLTEEFVYQAEVQLVNGVVNKA